MNLKNKKILVAYFSHTGQNYFNGAIVDLSKGNTEVVAEMIADLTEADLYEVQSVKEYPFDYNKCTIVAQSELRANSRPELANDIDINNYDVVFIGYPNWWGTMPMPVWIFLESHNFKGKTILPFCTHEGSGMGNSETDLKKICKDVSIEKGLAIYGSKASNARSAVEKWLQA